MWESTHPRKSIPDPRNCHKIALNNLPLQKAVNHVPNSTQFNYAELKTGKHFDPIWPLLTFSIKRLVEV